MNLTFKFGIGVFHITKQLLSHIFKIFDERENLKIFLINEFRSSKLKIRNKKKGRKISKDEMSALILALRDGIEVNKENYHKILQNKEFKKLNKEQIKKEKLGYSNEKSMILKEIAVKLLNNELSLSESRKKLRDYNLKTHNFSLK
jgi:ribosomal protein L16 Arg81 hydroxylase